MYVFFNLFVFIVFSFFNEYYIILIKKIQKHKVRRMKLNEKEQLKREKFYDGLSEDVLYEWILYNAPYTDRQQSFVTTFFEKSLVRTAKQHPVAYPVEPGRSNSGASFFRSPT